MAHIPPNISRNEKALNSERWGSSKYQSLERKAPFNMDQGGYHIAHKEEMLSAPAKNVTRRGPEKKETVWSDWNQQINRCSTKLN